MTTAIAEYSPTEAALGTLAERYKGVVYDVARPEGMTTAKQGRAEIRGYRVALEKKRVEIKAPALERSRLIDAEAKRITAELEALENPIDEQIKKEEGKAEAERKRIAQAEVDRVQALERAEKEAEEKKMAEARADIERRQAELDKAEAVQRDRDAVARQAVVEMERAAAKKREAAEAEERKRRDKVEAEKREIERKKNEVLDAHEMLRVFKARFGHLKEFAQVIGAINAIKVRK